MIYYVKLKLTKLHLNLKVLKKGIFFLPKYWMAFNLKFINLSFLLLKLKEATQMLVLLQFNISQLDSLATWMLLVICVSQAIFGVIQFWWLHDWYLIQYQALSQYDLTVQENLPVRFPNKREIYLRTCHPALGCDKMPLPFLKARISYS